ncbi:hypothetical protein [Nocardia sp. NPDC051570]|uniref:hypothetical protein n=1 Tax=Nocardia sp. NPDC051570 TaxID=3364324 RepID=UPI00379FE73F
MTEGLREQPDNPTPRPKGRSKPVPWQEYSAWLRTSVNAVMLVTRWRMSHHETGTANPAGTSLTELAVGVLHTILRHLQ